MSQVGPVACDRWFEALSALVDGELDGDERVALEGHLASCPSCRALEDRLSSMRRRVLVHGVTPRPDLAAAIVARSDRRRQVSRTLATRVAGVAVVAAAVAAVIVPLAHRHGSAASEAAAVGVTTVEVDQRSFSQGELDVAVGTTVRWQNRSATAHRLVHQVPGATVVGPLAPGQVETITFDEPGTYRYYCSIHAGMTGTVVVES